MRKWLGLFAAFGIALVMGAVTAPVASANEATVSGDVRCETSGEGARIVWTFTNDTDSPLEISLVSNEGGKVRVRNGLVATLEAAPAGGTSTGTGAQNGVPTTLETASITVLATWADGEEQNLTGTVSIADACGPTPETPEAPVINQSPACEVAGKLIIPDSPIATYYLNGEEVSGTLDGPISGTVTAEAKEGHVLTGTTSWEVEIAAADACEDNEIRAAAPVVVEPSACGVQGALTIPATPNVSYFWNGEPIEAGTLPGPLSGTVSALADPGYVLTGTDEWTIELAAAEDCPPTPPTTPGTNPSNPQAPGAIPSLPADDELAYTGASTWLALVGVGVVLLGLGLRFGAIRLRRTV